MKLLKGIRGLFFAVGDALDEASARNQAYQEGPSAQEVAA